ncbi:unnamed protein product [Polarella glacialis]|uniref:Uncharacterized protein n=1 Tax=Polarella glacialis TaxID=89957 RepID=A0A813JBH0_POLGL|nr:unnamed protein product [Polarella glacialis]
MAPCISLPLPAVSTSTNSDSESRSPVRRHGGNSSPAEASPSGAENSSSWAATSQRQVAIRSRVLMQRTAWGPRGTALPKELVPMGKIDNASCAAGSSPNKYSRSTQFVGEGRQMVPVELVSVSSALRHAPVRSGDNFGWTAKQDEGKFRAESGHLRHETPPLTTELRLDLKQRLDGLQSVCRADFKAHPRSTRFFLKELWEVCGLLKVPVIKRYYRRSLASALYHFVLLLPELLPADMAPSAAELADDGFVTLSLMLALGNVSWEYQFNGTWHRLCNCASLYPGCTACMVPSDGIKSIHAPKELAPLTSRSTERKLSSAGVFGGSVLAAGGSGAVIARDGRKPSVSTARPSALTNAADGQPHLRGQVKHFPLRLLDLSKSLKARFQEFARQVPAFLEDLLSIPEQPSAERAAHAHHCWDRWAVHVISEISVLDRYYMEFERVYMSLVEKLIKSSLEPVRTMTGPSDALIRGAGDPFREVQTAAFCQRLGLLKQQVNFGGRHQILLFDPGLLEKARRVLQMDTHKGVHDMANSLLRHFEVLCRVMVGLQVEDLKPELKENAELRVAVLNLEREWATAQYVLQQPCVDFIKQVLKKLPMLNERLRCLSGLALSAAHHKDTMDQPAPSPKEMEQARVALYQTLPMTIYMHELWDETRPADPSTPQENSLEGATAAGSEPQRPVPRYKRVFCPTDERHDILHRDFRKFDESRWDKFYKYMDGEDEYAGAGDTQQNRYFQIVMKQLQAIAAFPVRELPDDALVAASTSQAAMRKAGVILPSGGDNDEVEQQRLQESLEGAARWVCVMQMVQSISPQFLPHELPASMREEKLLPRVASTSSNNLVAGSSSPKKSATKHKLSVAAVANSGT